MPRPKSEPRRVAVSIERVMATAPLTRPPATAHNETHQPINHTNDSHPRSLSMRSPSSLTIPLHAPPLSTPSSSSTTTAHSAGSESNQQQQQQQQHPFTNYRTSPTTHSNGSPSSSPASSPFTLDTPPCHLFTHASSTSSSHHSALERSRHQRKEAQTQHAQQQAEARKRSQEETAEAKRPAKRAKTNAAAASESSAAAASASASSSAAVPSTPDDVQFEVDRLLSKRVRFVSRKVLKRLRVWDASGQTAEEICLRDFDELLEEEEHALRRGTLLIDQPITHTTTTNTPTPPSRPLYSLLNPTIQLPLVEYRIRWKGYTDADDSWEPKWNIHHAMIDELEREIFDRKKRAALSSVSLPVDLLLTHPKRSEIDPATLKAKGFNAAGEPITTTTTTTTPTPTTTKKPTKPTTKPTTAPAAATSAAANTRSSKK